MPRIFQAGVGRRLFLLFVLSALVPLAAIAFVSLAQVRELLLQQGDQRLLASAKAQGMLFFDRLQLAAETAQAAMRGRSVADPADSRVFQSLAIAGPGKQVTMISGREPSPLPPVAAMERLASGKPAAYVVAGKGGYAVHLAAPGADGVGFAFGEVRPLFLWGPADEAPHGMEFCVMQEGSRAVLHCQAPEGEKDLRAFGASGTQLATTATWTRDQQLVRSRAWPQFMGAAFGTADWVVLASQPESLMLERLSEFQRIYVPAVVLALVLVTWFTIRQSRSIVEPLGKLARRAREISSGNFAGRLEMDRSDEFGDVAGAFDQMSTRLGRQFASLTALAEIDGLVLSSQDTTQVVRAVLNRLQAIAPHDHSTITIFDQEGSGSGQTYSLPPGMDGMFMIDRHELLPGEAEGLAADASGRWVALPVRGTPPAHLAHAGYAGMRQAFVQPIVWRGTVHGTIVIGYRDGEAPREDAQRIREIADRVAVAVSSAWRDEALYQQAHFDPLTGSPNRLLFMDRLGIEIARSEREQGAFAVLFVDLDHFKNVNDSFGHSTGDLVLREAAARIRGCIRSADTLARLGGDEFTVILTNLQHAQEAWLIAETIVGALSREMVIGEQRCFISASVGIASYPADGRTAEEVMRSADTAVYRAKAEGRSQVVFFEEGMNSEVLARLTLDRDLRVAIERGELEMHYQPQMDLRSGGIGGVEALLRWRHPTRGMIPPVRFIPLAEESGFIEQLGQWAFEQCCGQMARWKEEGVEIPHVAVNVSPRQFRRKNFVSTIGNCVAAARLEASSIEIEVTEGLLIQTGEAVESMLQELADAGHGIALDDFGTGFSSMAYLKRLPVHTIKIDRVFVDGIEKGGEAEALVAAMIAMSHALGKKVVAEGVETQEQLGALRRLGCDQIQGYVLSPALPAAELVAFVRAHEASVASVNQHAPA